MNNERRSELVRLVAGSLLSSFRSERELRSVVFALEEERGLVEEVAGMLRTVLSFPVAPSTGTLGVEPSSHPLAQVAYQAIQRQKISKGRLLSELALLAPRMDLSQSKNVTTKELLQRFFAESSAIDGTKLLKRLGISVSQDPYLRGINER